MAQKLTRKEQIFVDEYVATGNGVQSALKAFDTKDYNTAGVIAHEYLNKPKLQHAIGEKLNDEFLEEQHSQLFDQKQINYFSFAKTMSDEEIVAHCASVGVTVITVRESDKGKLAFYAIKDAQAVKAALDMAYKLKGKYAPDKHVNVNFEAEPNDKVEELTKKLNG